MQSISQPVASRASHLYIKEKGVAPVQWTHEHLFCMQAIKT